MTHEVAVYVLVDAAGDAVASTDPDRVAELYEADVGGDAAVPRRLVKVVLTVPVSEAVVLRGDVPADGAAVLAAG